MKNETEEMMSVKRMARRRGKVNFKKIQN